MLHMVAKELGWMFGDSDSSFYQELRIGDFPSQNVTPSLPGRLSVGPPVPGGYAHSSGPQYPNNAFVRPPLAMMGPSDPIHLSAAEIYRQKHEVTATVCSFINHASSFAEAASSILIEIKHSFLLLENEDVCRILLHE